MTKMLEKAAQGMFDALAKPDAEGGIFGWIGDGSDLAIVTVDGEVDLLALARAAILAIREADDAVRAVGTEHRIDGLGADDIFTAMIDAILGDEKP